MMNEKSLLEILQDSLKKIKKIFLPLIVYIIILSFFIALLNILIFDITGLNWKFYDLKDQNNTIDLLLKANPNYELSSTEIEIQKSYSLYFYILNIIKFSLPIFMLLSLVLISSKKINDLYLNNNDSTCTWISSIKAPFSNKSKFKSSLFYIIGGSFLIAIGAYLFIFPGIIIMSYVLFSLVSITLDGKTGKEAYRNAKYYLTNNFLSMFLIIIIGILVPIILQSLYLEPVLELFNLNQSNFELWLNPDDFHYGKIFLFEFCKQLLENLPYFWFPSLFFSTYLKIKGKKVDITNDTNFYQTPELDREKKISEIREIAIKKGQLHYYCDNCGEKIPISKKKCQKCQK